MDRSTSLNCTSNRNNNKKIKSNNVDVTHILFAPDYFRISQDYGTNDTDNLSQSWRSKIIYQPFFIQRIVTYGSKKNYGCPKRKFLLLKRKN